MPRAPFAKYHFFVGHIEDVGLSLNKRKEGEAIEKGWHGKLLRSIKNESPVTYFMNEDGFTFENAQKLNGSNVGKPSLNQLIYIILYFLWGGDVLYMSRMPLI